MGAPVLLVKEAFEDRRFRKLGRLLGVKHAEFAAALGRGLCARIYSLCIEARIEVMTETELDEEFDAEDLGEKLIAAELGEREASGIRIRGMAEAIAKYEAALESKAAGGRARAAAAQRVSGRFAAARHITNNTSTAGNSTSTAGAAAGALLANSPAEHQQPTSSPPASESESEYLPERGNARARNEPGVYDRFKAAWSAEFRRVTGRAYVWTPDAHSDRTVLGWLHAVGEAEALRLIPLALASNAPPGVQDVVGLARYSNRLIAKARASPEPETFAADIRAQWKASEAKGT